MESTQIAELLAKHQKCDKILDLIEQIDDRINANEKNGNIYLENRFKDAYNNAHLRLFIDIRIKQRLIRYYINQSKSL